MKIGILTFHCAHNYGAVLQAYALQEYIKTLGHEVEIIDYRPWYLLVSYKVFSWKRLSVYGIKGKIKYCLTSIINFKNKYLRRKNFESFITSYLNLSKQSFTNYNKLKKITGYDIIIVGSDQIWNTTITRKIDKSYFGVFENRANIKKVISYAASMKCDNITEYTKNEYISCLQNIDAISVREHDVKELLTPLLHQKPIAITVDPSLLLDFNTWNTLVPSLSVKQKYVLVYQVRPNENTLIIAQHIAEQIGAIVIEIEAWMSLYPKKNKSQTASPQEFLGYIKNASCVVTTSFHATVFSVIFNRPFYTIALNNSADNRSQSVLQSLNLSHRMINYSERPRFETIDYSKTTELLDSIKTNSENFLKQSIHG